MSRRIFFLNDFPHSIAYGGKEVQLERYYEALKRENFDVKLLDSWTNANLTNEDIVHLFGSTKVIHSFIMVLKNKKTKIYLSPNFYVKNKLSERMKNLIFSRLPLPNTFKFRREMFQNADKIIVNSNSEKDLICFSYKICRKKVSIVLNGIDEDLVEIQNMYSNPVMNFSENYLLSVGALDERKNTIKLIKAFLKISNDVQEKLVLVGDFRFGNPKNQERCQKLIAENPNKILHLPFLSKEKSYQELKELFSNCTAHLLPSILETPGISSLEAHAFFKPILVGECDPVKDYFGDEAIYCKPRSVNSIAKGIIECIALSKYPLNYKKRFFWNNTTKALTQLYISNQNHS